MLIRRLRDAEPAPVQMPGADRVAMSVMVGRADGAPTFAMRLFEVEPGGHTPRHDHNYEHEILILDGRGEVIDGGDGGATRAIEAGDVIFIPANQEHQFRNVGKRPLRFVCLVPTQFDCSGQAQPTPGS
jgi:quercetin dioxygenase-like cupin family protein